MDTRIDAGALRAAIGDVAPEAVLVRPRVLRRIIKQHGRLRGLGLQVPHEECLAARPSELRGLRDARDLPLPHAETVLLLPAPEPGLLATQPREVVLRRYWRLLFHARLDAHLLGAIPDDAAEAVVDRVHAVGQVELDEIRLVLRQERRVLPPGGDPAIWREFAALFLELRAFAPDQVAHWFPILEDLERVEAIIARDVDAAAVLAASRPAGAPDAPAPALDLAPSEHGEALRSHGAAAPEGVSGRTVGARPPLVENLVRAAIQAVRRGESGAAQLRSLAEAMADTVEGGPLAGEWEAALRPALARCDRTLRPEARLLLDVQRAAHEQGREVLSPDVLGWALSGGRRPVARPLPAQRRFRVLRALHRARRRVPGLALPAADGLRLSRALERAVSACEAAIRAELRPRLHEALDDVGLAAASAPERVAREKLLDELLDRVITRGFLRMGDVRDALSRSQLKLRDLTGAREAWSGDAMLRLDARLGDVLDGVYRQGEIYMRGLQRVSALAFGTPAGRAVTRYALLPFGGAFVILEGLQHMVGPLVRLAGGGEIHLLTTGRLLVLGLTLLALIQSATARTAAWWVLSGVGRVLRAVLLEAPRWLLGRPLVRRVLGSRPVRLVRRVLLRPLLLAALVWWLFPALGAGTTASAIAGAALYVAFGLLINSRWGRVVEEATADFAASAWSRLRHAIIPGLVRLVLDLFTRLLNDIERVLYAVDERLRYRRGQSQAAFVAKAAAGVVWGVVTWVVRLYVNVLIEPQVNPIKHFPVVTVSHKLTLPFAIPLTRALAGVIEPLLGPVLAGTVAGTTVLLMPGAFGFLAWELKENWRLFGANRSRTLRPALVGSHGETLLRLMRPGLHSGTLPKLFARLRRADRGLRGQRDTKAMLVVRRDLHHVQDAVRAFVERELVALLRETGVVTGALRVGRVTLASNRIRVEIALDGHPHAMLLGLEEQSGRVVASMARAGWLETLTDTQAARFTLALTGFYALGGVDLVREQVAEALPPGALYDVASPGLLVWLGGDPDPWVYTLGPRRMVPHRRRRTPPRPPVLEARQVRFGATPVPWQRWLEVWSTADHTTPLVPGRLTPRTRVSARLRTDVPRLRSPARPSRRGGGAEVR